MVIVLLAKMAGQESVSGIAEWASLREEQLKAMHGLRRMPCATTYAYISTHLDSSELAAQPATYFEQFETEAVRTVRQPRVATVLAVLNSTIRALFDHLKIANARKARRHFDARPDTALAQLI